MLVTKAYRKKGFGTTILKYMIRDAAAVGAKKIYLITDKDDAPIQMYQRIGFEIIGVEMELSWFLTDLLNAFFQLICEI